MSNTFTRGKYDVYEQNQFINNNKNYNNWIMDLNSRENKSGCMNAVGTGQGASNVNRPLNTEGFLDFGRFVDIESRVQNRHLGLNDPARTNKDYENFERNNIPMCSTKETFVNEDSRFVVPNARGDRQDKQIFSNYLHMNPQNVHAAQTNVFNSPVQRMGQSTRYVVKNPNFDKSMTDYKNEISSTNLNTQYPSLLPNPNARLVKAFEYGK